MPTLHRVGVRRPVRNLQRSRLKDTRWENTGLRVDLGEGRDKEVFLSLARPSAELNVQALTKTKQGPGETESRPKRESSLIYLIPHLFIPEQFIELLPQSGPVLDVGLALTELLVHLGRQAFSK